MHYEEFVLTLNAVRCPEYLGPYLEALWYEASDDWHKAHIIVQDIDHSTAARIHAYLHRKEGDIWNSKYWYRHAGCRFPQGMRLQDEWEMLAHQLTGDD
jgi:hypothetical protein